MRESLRLQATSGDLRDSYRSLIAELESAGEKRVPFPLSFPFDDFDALLARLQDSAKGIGLEEGFVPHSTYWLVRDGEQIVGVSNLRHSLTPFLLREGGHIGYGIRPSMRGRRLGSEILRRSLHRTRELGIRDVLVTCGAANVASASVIRRNGGVLESEAFLPERNEVVQRYWIRGV